jgi:hypothetical protein
MSKKDSKVLDFFNMFQYLFPNLENVFLGILTSVGSDGFALADNQINFIFPDTISADDPYWTGIVDNLRR